LGELLTLRGKCEDPRVMKVNATPVYGDDGKQRGVLASFDDVTQIEQSRVELRQMLGSISSSRDEIRRQNIELEQLASQDPLTSCLNRRAFFTELEEQWSSAMKEDRPLACIMIDLDHFKMINDKHGHQSGDMVLKTAARLIRTGQRAGDLVCRYGGEEFCIALPNGDLEAASTVAEKIRAKLEAHNFSGLSVTASIGVSATSLGASDPESMIDQADKCLYIAKDAGRNQVVRFDEARDRIAESEKKNQSATRRDEKKPVAENKEEPLSPFFASDPIEPSNTTDSICDVADTDTSDVVSQVVAFGTLVEQLADALDEQGFDGVGNLAQHLNKFAIKHESSAIADVTSRLEEAARDADNGKELVQLTCELVDLCRVAQQAHLNESAAPSREKDDCQLS
jgi:diguanylate cyclase (GGDEF)-like protein